MTPIQQPRSEASPGVRNYAMDFERISARDLGRDAV